MSNSFDFDHYTTGTLEPISNHVLVDQIETANEQVRNGIILMGENSSTRGIRPRWAHVAAIGPEQKDIKVGEWVLVDHGRWTRGVKLDDGKIYRRVDQDEILLVTDEKPKDIVV